MIRNIIFDLGMVLIHCDMEYAASEIGKLSHLDAQTIHAALLKTNLIHQFDQGLHTKNEFNREIQKLTGWRGSATELEKIWQAMLTPDPAMFEVLEEVHAAGYRTYILSNINPFHVEQQPREYPRILETHGQIFSCECRLIKPDPKIFEHTRDTFGIVPEESIFIDDKAENIESAQSVGFLGIVHQDAERTRKEIERLTGNS